MSRELLNARHIEQYRQTHRVLQIDQLVLKSAHCALLRGANGAGKTTLLRLLGGLDQSSTMQLTLHQQPIKRADHRRALRKTCVYVHQQPYLFDRSVFDNIAYGLRAAGHSRTDIQQRVQAALASANLSHLSTRNGKQLSGGESRRVALMRAYVLQPDIVLLDEPIAGLDESSATDTLLLLEKMRDQGMGILMSSHDLRTSGALFDQCWQLQDGRLVDSHVN